MTMILVGVAVAVAVYIVLSRRRGSGLSKQQIQSLLDDGGIVVDVRTPAEFERGHVEQAINVPLNRLESDLNEIAPKSKPILLYCGSGLRSSTAEARLRSAGFEHAINVGGMSSWPL
jgi:phage shock protein E